MILGVNVPCKSMKRTHRKYDSGTALYVESVAVRWLEKRGDDMERNRAGCHGFVLTSLQLVSVSAPASPSHIKQRDVCNLRRPRGSSSGRDEEITRKIRASES